MKHIRHAVFGEAFEGSCQSARLGPQSSPSAPKFHLAEVADRSTESPEVTERSSSTRGQVGGAVGQQGRRSTHVPQFPHPALWRFSGGLAPRPSLASGRKRLQPLLGRRGLLFGALCAVQNLGNELGDLHAAGRVLLQERHVQQLGVGGPLGRLLLQAGQRREGERKKRCQGEHVEETGTLVYSAKPFITPHFFHCRATEHCPQP